MSDPHGPELGRPRYRPPAGSGPLLPGQRPAPSGPEGPQRTSNAAVTAIVIASIGWILPILGGVAAIRRGNAALRSIEASGGALDGLGLALWARRLGWFYVVAWSALLFMWFGGAGIQLFYALLRRLL
jgi:Trk-type K+ transport system membrane component